MLFAGPLKTAGNATLRFSRKRQSRKSYFCMQNTGLKSCRGILRATHMAPFKSVSDLAIQSLQFTLSATSTSVMSYGFTSYGNKTKQIWSKNTPLPLIKTRNQKHYNKKLLNSLSFVFILTLISEIYRLLYPDLILGVSTVFYITTTKKCH